MRLSITINNARLRVPSVRRVLVLDAEGFKEEQHKRDAGGQFSKMSMSNKIEHTANAAKGHGIKLGGAGTGSAVHEGGWHPYHAKLLNQGFVPDKFAKKAGGGEHATSQTYTHPSGASAKLDYHEQLGGGTKYTMVSMKGTHSSVAAYSPTPEYNKVLMQQSAGVKISEMAKPAPPKAPEPDKEYTEPKHETKTIAKSKGTEEPSPPKPEPVELPKKAAKLAENNADLHKVAEMLKPDLAKYTLEDVRKHHEKKIGELEAAAKSGNPVEALKAVDVHKSRTKLVAYKAALIAAHSNQPQNGAPPPGAPKTSVAVTKDEVHSGTVALKGVDKDDVYTAGVDAKGKEVTGHLNIDKTECPAEYRDGPPPKMQEDAWYKWHAAGMKKLTPAEQAAQQEYQNGSGYINGPLRDGTTPSPGIKATIDALQSACLKGRIAQTVEVQRGLSSDMEKLIDFGHPELSIGGVFEHKNFVSTSRATGFGGKTRMHMTLPAGAPGHTMKLFNKHNPEAEILLPHSSVFRIDKIVKKGGTHHVHCTYLGVKDASKNG